VRFIRHYIDAVEEVTLFWPNRYTRMKKAVKTRRHNHFFTAIIVLIDAKHFRILSDYYSCVFADTGKS